MRRVVARVDAAGGEPVAQFVVVGGHGEHHAHVEGLALLDVPVHHRLQVVRLDRVHWLAVFVGHVLFHLRPDGVGDGDAVTVQIHGEGRDDVRLGAEADRRRQGLAGEHVRAVELAVDYAVQQHLPVGLRLEGDVQALVLEVAVLVGHRQRRHVGELDKAELQFILLRLADGGVRRGQQAGQGGGGDDRGKCAAPCRKDCR